MSKSNRAKTLLLAASLMVAGACAPGHAIVRGNWPDGRLESPTRGRTMAVPVRSTPRAEPIHEEWTAAEPGPDALAAADLNRMNVLQTIYFDFDSSVIRGDQVERVRDNADWLTANPDAVIIIEGHCDERGTREYNMALGQMRADATRDFIVSLGVDPGRIETLSFGEELPAVSGHEEAAWAANRRSVLVITAMGGR